MNRNFKNSTLLTGALTLLLMSACASNTGPASGKSDVDIAFSLNAGGTPLECGKTYHNVGATSADMSLQDARLYVSNLRFVTADGQEAPLALTQDGVWQNEDLALLDFENATGACNGNPVTNKTVRGTVPDGDYVGFAFDLGVPERMNHQDPTLAAPPLNLSALSWPWRAGYKFTTIDLETAIQTGAVEGAPGFSIHIGATHCGEGSPVRPPSVACEWQNRPSVRLDRFDPARQVVVLDLAALLAETDVTSNEPETPSGCMSGDDDADCDGIFRRAGLRGATQMFVRAE